MPNMIRTLKKHIKFYVSDKYKYLNQFTVMPGDIVIDLGANVGEVTEYFLMKKAHIFAYEPNPHAAKIFKQRLKNNPNVKFFQCAVSNFSGQSQLFLHTQHHESEVGFSQASSLQAEKSNVSEDFIEVEVQHIQDILNIHDHIRLIKIDIEGGEYDIMDDILAQADKIDYILLETHGHKNKAFEEKECALQKKIGASPHKKKYIRTGFKYSSATTFNGVKSIELIILLT